MYASPFILGYFSPETVLPLTSIVATIAGAAMLLTKGSLRFLFRCLRAAIRRPKPVEVRNPPHFHGAEVPLAEKAHH
jgi:hypothetical protein